MYFASRALQEDGATIATLRKELHAARTQIGRLQDDVEGERAARAAAESRAGRLALLSDEDGDGSTSKQHRIDALEAALQSSEERAAEERSRAADVKALWKSVVDTLREENEALTAALAAARRGGAPARGGAAAESQQPQPLPQALAHPVPAAPTTDVSGLSTITHGNGFRPALERPPAAGPEAPYFPASGSSVLSASSRGGPQRRPPPAPGPVDRSLLLLQQQPVPYAAATTASADGWTGSLLAVDARLPVAAAVGPAPLSRGPSTQLLVASAPPPHTFAGGGSTAAPPSSAATSSSSFSRHLVDALATAQHEAAAISLHGGGSTNPPVSAPPREGVLPAPTGYPPAHTAAAISAPTTYTNNTLFVDDRAGVRAVSAVSAGSGGLGGGVPSFTSARLAGQLRAPSLLSAPPPVVDGGHSTGATSGRVHVIAAPATPTYTAAAAAAPPAPPPPPPSSSSRPARPPTVVSLAAPSGTLLSQAETRSKAVEVALQRDMASARARLAREDDAISSRLAELERLVGGAR